jgi:ubiquinone/menaquinone biosynthesis C-methylase UbiE
LSTQPGNNEAAKPPQPVSGEVGDLLRVRSFYDKSAHSYDRWLAAYGRVTRIDGRRDRLLSRARGRVLGVGVGTGRNLAAYPIDAQITGVDASPAMLQFAATRASELGRAAELRTGDAQGLDFSDDEFDTVVAVLVLSAVPDQNRVIAEIRRVLKPGGRLLVLDHSRSSIAPVRWMQRIIDPIFARYARWHIARDLLSEVRSAGFALDETRRSALGTLLELDAHR